MVESLRRALQHKMDTEYGLMEQFTKNKEHHLELIAQKFWIESLENLQYGLSRNEALFRRSARAGLALIFILWLVHTILRMARFKNTKWLPHIDSPDLADGVRTMMRLLEVEFAPTILALALLISVGALYKAGMILFGFGILCVLILFCAYRMQSYFVIRLGRVILFGLTICMYGIILFNDHIFEDSTLPQVLEQFMTHEAMYSHGLSKGQSTGLHFRDEMYKNAYLEAFKKGDIGTNGLQYRQISEALDAYYSKAKDDRPDLYAEGVLEKMKEDPKFLGTLDVWEDTNGRFHIMRTVQNEQKIIDYVAARENIALDHANQRAKNDVEKMEGEYDSSKEAVENKNKNDTANL